ncbi:MAG: hypothetical protein VX421_11060, partial [Pseudomonadota bacterium]|nr:hypothetical protein [Pseudomonadota bacterium]
MHKSVPLLLTALFGLTLAGCASLNGTDASSAPEAKTAKAGQSSSQAPVEYADFEPETLYLLLSAEIAAQRGRYDITLVNYLNAAKQSRDPGVIERAMRIAQSLNGDNAQKQLAELWLEVDPDNLQAHRISAIQAVKGSDLQTAMHHMEQIMNQGGDADFDSLAAMASNLPAENQQELLSLY